MLYVAVIALLLLLLSSISVWSQHYNLAAAKVCIA